MSIIKAVIFDLYGTLLQFDQRAMLRDLGHVVGGSRGRDMRETLRKMLVQTYPSDTDLTIAWCRALGVASPNAQQISSCHHVLQEHLANIQPFNGARTLLAFLRRRGFRLGLLSNASQTFAVPLKALALEPYFDRISLSYATGLAKPDPAAYLAMCRDLDVPPEHCLFVGDSDANDYQAPRALGMQALCLRHRPGSPPSDLPEDISSLAWASLCRDADPFHRLLAPDARLTLDDAHYRVIAVQTLPDQIQGRYNIIGHVRAIDARGANREFYCKRYLAPESAHVEYWAYQIMRLITACTCRAWLLPTPEPLLLVTPAPGRLWSSSDMGDATAEAIGSHCAAAYLVGNADLRPRNTFVHRTNDDIATVSIIDLEHCFFDRALDTHDLLDPFHPAAIDALECSFVERTKHKVLSSAAIHRVRKGFLPVEDRADSRVQRFRRGWIATFTEAKQQARTIQHLLMERIYERPHLVIGTQSYRRAMAAVDVRDIMERIDEDAAEAFERLY